MRLIRSRMPVASSAWWRLAATTALWIASIVGTSSDMTARAARRPAGARQFVPVSADGGPCRVQAGQVVAAGMPLRTGVGNSSPANEYLLTAPHQDTDVSAETLRSNWGFRQTAAARAAGRNWPARIAAITGLVYPVCGI
jgi:hypothetical protein